MKRFRKYVNKGLTVSLEKSKAIIFERGREGRRKREWKKT